MGPKGGGGRGIILPEPCRIEIVQNNLYKHSHLMLQFVQMELKKPVGRPRVLRVCGKCGIELSARQRLAHECMETSAAEKVKGIVLIGVVRDDEGALIRQGKGFDVHEARIAGGMQGHRMLVNDPRPDIPAGARVRDQDHTGRVEPAGAAGDDLLG